MQLVTVLANWNGSIMPLVDVMVPVLDRAFLFGDAVYEALRIYGGKPFLFAEHMRRLKRSTGEIDIACDINRLQRRLQETLAACRVQEGLIYIQVTRGVAPRRTHRFPDPPPAPNELIWVEPIDVDPYAAYRESGAHLISVDDLRWRRCDIKSVNLLANCLASQAAAVAGCAEAVLVGADGSITEGSHTSVFGVRGGKILTAPLRANILPGITRALVLELARRAAVGVVEQPMNRAEVGQLDELFLTGTTAEVLPVTRLDDEAIGDGTAGPVVRKLTHAYREYVDEWLAGAAAHDDPA